MKKIQEIVENITELENLITQLDNWNETFLEYGMRRDLVKEFAQNDDVRTLVPEFEENARQAFGFAEGCRRKLLEIAGTDDLDTLRIRVTRLKALLNTMMERHADRFVQESGLQEMDAESMFALAQEILDGERDE